jgi:hypothetical protein
MQQLRELFYKAKVLWLNYRFAYAVRFFKLALGPLNLQMDANNKIKPGPAVDRPVANEVVVDHQVAYNTLVWNHQKQLKALADEYGMTSLA